MMEQGVSSRKNQYHSLYFSYIANTKPQTTTMVPRKINPLTGKLNCHTDIRSRKIECLKKNPNVALLLWCRDQKTQLRMNGTVEIHHQDDTAKAIWNSVRPMSKVCYCADIAPSTQSSEQTSGFSTNQWLKRHDIIETDFAYMHFAILSIQLEEIERLDLSAAGHFKIQFHRDEGKNTWTHQWLAP